MIITTNSAMQSGLQGYQDASSNMLQAASQLAQGQNRNINVNSAATSLQESSLQAQASVEVIKRADGMIGTIIDIFV